MKKVILALAIAASLAQSAAAFEFKHPGFGLSCDDLDYLKAHAKEEPYASALAELKAATPLGYRMRGPFEEVSRTPNRCLGEWCGDMQMIYNSARMWYLTGNEAYAKQGRDILLAWAKTHKRWSGAESYLSMGDFAYRLYGGAEILRGTWPGWTEEDTTTVKKYFLKNYWGAANVPRPLRSANQGALQLVTGVGVAIFCDDVEKLKQCLAAYRDDVTGGLADTLPNGEIGDSGRDQGHAYGQFLHLALIAEAFWTQGIDVYSLRSNRLLACAEFYSRFNVGKGLDFIPFGSEYDCYPGHGGAPGSVRKCPDLLNILRTAYVVRKGMSAPYLEEYLSQHRENGESIMFRRDKDASRARTLREQEKLPLMTVSKLEAHPVGSVPSGASATLRNGVWTVKGTGGHIANPRDVFYMFHSLPMEGDGAIVVRCDSIESDAPHPIAGIAFAEDLNPSSRLLTIHMVDKIELKGVVTPRVAVGMWRSSASSHNRFGQMHRRWDSSVTMPRWLKLERRGSRVTAFHSIDGASWSPMQNVDFDGLAKTCYVGLFVAEGENVTARFSHLRMTCGDGRGQHEAPATPIQFFSSPSPKVIHLRWLESSGADTYRIERAAGAGENWEELGTTDKTEWIDKAVRADKTYRYRLTPVSAKFGEGSPVELTAAARLP